MQIKKLNREMNKPQKFHDFPDFSKKNFPEFSMT